MRSDRDVRRGAILSLTVNGKAATAFEGETIAAALLALDVRAFRFDRNGRPRGLFCNMGVCGECLVTISHVGASVRRVRACMTPVAPDMVISTDAAGGA